MDKADKKVTVMFLPVGSFRFTGKKLTYLTVFVGYNKLTETHLYDLLAYKRESTTSQADVLKRDATIDEIHDIVKNLEKDL